jgi:glycosyltransferase involved in cell wall biosynthesis
VPLRGLSPLGDLKLLWSFYRQLRRAQPAVFHAFTIKPVIYGTLAAVLAGVPRRVCTITGLGHAFTESGRGVNLLAQMLYRLALGEAHVVFFQNAEDRDLFLRRRLVAVEKTRLVSGSGVDLERFERTPHREGLGHRPTRFVMVARLLREKGVMEFMEAAEQARAAGANAEFRLVGAQDTRNPTGLDESQIARLKTSPVEWIGPLEDVRAELAAADVVVLPSYREGTPRSLLEAMAVGRPVVTTDAPGCRQLVEPGINGLLVPPKTVEPLAAALKQMANMPERLPQMGDAACDFVRRNYDEAGVIEMTISAYALNPAGRGQ